MSTTSIVEFPQQQMPVADTSRAAFAPGVNRLTTEDRHEILYNARLVSWSKPILGGNVELYPPVFVPGNPVPKYWRKRFARERVEKSRRNVSLGRQPFWTGESRPSNYQSVELVRPDITEEMLVQFASHWLTRNLRWTLEGNHDASNPLTYTSTRPPAERLARGENYMDAEAVAAFLMRQRAIRKLLCYPHGEEIVTELQRVLTYGTKVDTSAEKLASLGVTEDGFRRRVSRLRKAMKEQMELPHGKKVIEALMVDAPEGTKDVLERASKRAGRKVGALTKFEQYFDRAQNPVKYLGERQ